MRLCLTPLIFLAGSMGLLAQGTVNFNNSPGAIGGTGAPVMACYEDSIILLEGTAWLTQLYAGPEINSLQPWGDPLSFRTGSGAGFFDTRGVNTVRVIDTVVPGAVATIEVRVWQSVGGTTYEQAFAGGFITGRSPALIVTTGGAGAPPALPANLVGLTFPLPLSCIPEPSTNVLLLLGTIGVWWGAGLRRRSTSSP